jgi:hypothetical protein
VDKEMLEAALEGEIGSLAVAAVELRVPVQRAGALALRLEPFAVEMVVLDSHSISAE